MVLSQCEKFDRHAGYHFPVSFLHAYGIMGNERNVSIFQGFLISSEHLWYNKSIFRAVNGRMVIHTVIEV